MTELYRYESLKKQYGEFAYPLVQVWIQEKNFGENGSGLYISELEAELSSGFEASAVTFSVYGCYDVTDRCYRTEQLKKYACLGYSVRVLLGYGSRMREVFRGFIARLSYTGREGDPHHVQITALDIKGLMMSGCYARGLTAGCYSDAIEEIFTRSAYCQMYSAGIYERLSVAATPDKETGGKKWQAGPEMVTESDYEFVVKAAKRFNYEFFVDDGNVIFRRAKDTDICLMRLGGDAGILEYEIGYDMTGMVQTVEVRGMDSGRGQAVTADGKYRGRLSMGSRAKALLSQTRRVYVDGSISSRQEAAWRTGSLLEEMSYRLGTLEAECVGLPELKPGCFIEIGGFGQPADNRFYLTEVRHRISDTAGFRTRIRGKAASVTADH